MGDDLIAWAVEFGYDPTDTPARWFFAWLGNRETWYDDYADVIAAGVARAFEEDT